MPIKVHGITDATGASAGLAKNGKPVCIVALKGVGILTEVNKPFPIYSIADANNKFGEDSAGAKLATVLFKGGVKTIYGVIPTTVVDPVAQATNYDTAMMELLRFPNIKVVVLDTVLPTIHTKLGAFLDLAESQDILMYGVVGIDSSVVIDLSTYAGVLNNKRIFLPGPSVLDIDGVKLGGIYSAAGLASAISTETFDPALPMNGVELMGFGGVDSVLLTTEKDALVMAGVTPLYNSKDGNPTVYRLVTTYTKDLEGAPDLTWQEGTTIFISDDVLESCVNTIRTKYKRTKGVTRILKAMRTDILITLQGKNDLEIIENFNANTVSVIKDPNDMYGALIDYEYDVVTPLYTVTIRQHMIL